ncbi:hypothetical protein AAC691_08055 [Nguyenibacter vanlangensis]|uniref:Uncharacterized protein n=1 Tax=Nguyenibacter vanlangensis TaxID=1216886 RepID=A0ABZ3DA54_9PROT
MKETVMAHLPPPPVVTQEVRIVDAQGHTRILLSAKDDTPTILLIGSDGAPRAMVALDAAGRPAVTLSNPDPTWPSAALAIDDKGAHVKFDRPGGASSYLFLNNAGGSGMVLIDAAGKRRIGMTVTPDGKTKVERLGDDEKPLP